MATTTRPTRARSPGAPQASGGSLRFGLTLLTSDRLMVWSTTIDGLDEVLAWMRGWRGRGERRPVRAPVRPAPAVRPRALPQRRRDGRAPGRRMEAVRHLRSNCLPGTARSASEISVQGAPTPGPPEVWRSAIFLIDFSSSAILPLPHAFIAVPKDPPAVPLAVDELDFFVAARSAPHEK